MSNFEQLAARNCCKTLFDRTKFDLIILNGLPFNIIDYLEIIDLSTIQDIRIMGIEEAVRLESGFYQKIQKVAGLPGMRKLLPLARRLAGVAEKPGRMSIRTFPTHASQKNARQELTVISANLWHDWPQHRRAIERLEAFAKLVEEHNADVLLLQEVARTSDFWTDHWLAKRLGMSYVYSRANGHLQGIGFEEGLAIFSRHPLLQPVLRQLSPPSNRFVHRLALGTQIATPFGDFQAFSVHLGINGSQNTRQADLLHTWVQELSGSMPALVGGDFNAGELSRSIKNLKNHWLDTFRHLNPLADGTTHEIRWPWGKSIKRSRLDYIFLKAEQQKWKVLEALHLETPGAPHSDHRAVLLRLAPAYARI
jgi:endonuclease/exonuclease/phosphatase family metal-dependent hydrolase